MLAALAMVLGSHQAYPLSGGHNSVKLVACSILGALHEEATNKYEASYQEAERGRKCAAQAFKAEEAERETKMKPNEDAQKKRLVEDRTKSKLDKEAAQLREIEEATERVREETRKPSEAVDARWAEEAERETKERMGKKDAPNKTP